MSQTTFLESVVSWTEEKCQQSVDVALPKLITYCQEANVIQEQVGILKIIVQSFLPCVDVMEAERKVYSPVIIQVMAVFDKILETVKVVLGQNQHDFTAIQEELISLLQLLLDTVDCCETCVKFSQGSSVPLEWSHVHTLPVGTLHLLKGTYSHCKESGDVYGDYLTNVSESLSLLFRKTHCLQMTFLNLLDKVNIDDSATEQDACDLGFVCHGLFEVCQIVTSLDMKLVVNLWKAISRHAGQKKDLLTGRLDVDHILVYLCGQIQTGYSYLFQLLPQTDDHTKTEGDERGFQKSVKIVGFQMKVLVMMTRDYVHGLRDAHSAIYRLILYLLRHVPPSLYATSMTESHSQEIHRHLINATEPLVAALVCSRVFIEGLILAKQDLQEEERFPHLQVLVSIMDHLPKTTDSSLYHLITKIVNFMHITTGQCITYDSQVFKVISRCRIQLYMLGASISYHDEVKTLCLSPDEVTQSRDLLTVGQQRRDLLTMVFEAAHQCYVEMLLPVYMPAQMHDGKPQGTVTLYEYVCTHMCGLVGSFPAHSFPVLERVLLEFLLYDSPVCGSLAADVWCFLARYGSAELCNGHITVLIELCRTIRGHNSHRHQIVSLVCRLAKFLSPAHQVALVQRFPPGDDLDLWCDLPMNLLPGDQAKDIVDSLLSLCIKHIDTFINAAEVGCQHVSDLMCSLTFLTNVQSCPEICSGQWAVVDQVQTLWAGVFVSDWMAIPQTQVCLGKLIQYTGLIVTQLTNSDLLKIFSVMMACLGQSPCDSLKFSMVDFLKNFGKVQLSADFESKVLQKLAAVFGALMADTSCLVHHWSVEAFTRFAEDTVHETVVSECMERDSRLQDCVVAYLNKIPHLPTDEPTLGTADILQELWGRALTHKYSSLTDSATVQPVHKKARTMSPVIPVAMVTSGYEDLLESMKLCVRELEQVCRDKSTDSPRDEAPTPQLTTHLQNVQHKIHCLLTDHG